MELCLKKCLPFWFMENIRNNIVCTKTVFLIAVVCVQYLFVSASTVVFIATATAICRLGHGLRTYCGA